MSDQPSDALRAAPADAWGVVPAYEDASHAWVTVPQRTRDRMIEAMGRDPGAPPPEPTAAPLFVRTGRPVDVDGVREVTLETGESIPVRGRLPSDLPSGYHELRGDDGERLLVVSPGRCQPVTTTPSWGWAVQLYALRSRASWGVGDLADLRELGREAHAAGARSLLVNPLDAVTPVRPREPSPYFPTSRRFLDPLYLRIEEVPGIEVVDDLERTAAAAREASTTGLIDRETVIDAKLEVLEAVWRGSRQAGREPGFLAFLTERGSELSRFSTFCSLAEHFGGGWRSWPDAYRHPDAPAVAAHARGHADRIRFTAWLQWLCDRQLASAAAQIGLVGDLPIGVDPDGADAWEFQDVLADGVSIGAPPDELAPSGQDWGLPAFVPSRLRADGYRPLISTFRAAMRHMAGLRIDHVLGLFRLFWVPTDGTAGEGAYVRMPHRELLDLLALESQRAGTFVIGEDLGTVEEGVREELADRDILRTRVWWFETERQDAWDPGAVATVSTHDLPTIAGVWSGADEDAQRRIGLTPDPRWYLDLRRRLADVAGVGLDAPVGEVIAGVHRWVAATPCVLVLAQLDDAVAAEDRVNVPGTDRVQRPANWSVPLPVWREDLREHPGVRAVADVLNAVRGPHARATTGTAPDGRR